MNRTAVVAIVVAAVVGLSGGVAAGRLHVRGDRTPSGTASAPPPSGGSTGPSPSPSTTAPVRDVDNPLLYATDTAIQDGKTTVAINGPHHVSYLARYAQGYVVAEPTSSQAAEFDLWTIRTDGTAKDFASVDGDDWDLNVEGTLLVGTDSETGKLTVWDLGDGHVVAAWPKSTDATGAAGFAGDQVLIAQATNGNSSDLYRWNPDTGKTVKEKGGAPLQMALSPGGSYLSGMAAADDVDPANGCLTVRSTYLKKHATGWKSCAYQPIGDVTTFSPDGTRLLAVPKGHSGRFLSRLVTIDASDGPADLVGSFTAPPHTIAATWDTDDALYLYGSYDSDTDLDHGGWVDRCTLQGACRHVARVASPIVLAAIR